LNVDDRAIELAGAHQAAAERALHVATQSRAHIARDFDTLIRLDAKLLNHCSVTVIRSLRHLKRHKL